MTLIPALLAAVTMMSDPAGAAASPEGVSGSAPAAAASAPEQPAIERVGGDMAATVETTPEGFRFGRARVTTALPEGYPAPTPPGAIDIKRYPVVRRAEVTMEGRSDGNGGFWPLFRHIQRKNIAMTSPVEIDYHGMEEGKAGEAKPESSTMSFLYRSRDLGPAEPDGRVLVRDVAPMTVVSMGFMGPYGFSRAQGRLADLEAWLARNPTWERAGDPRMFCYNGPDVPSRYSWGEVQIPIRRVERPAPGADAEGG